MDQKSWIWRKKSNEKIVVSTERSKGDPKGNEEVEALLSEKEELEKDVKRLNDKLSSTLSECNDKDELVKQHIKMAQEALAGWQKTDAEVLSLKKELDETLHQQESYEQRVAHLDGALKECMQQLRFVREERDQSIHGAVVKTTNEFEKSKMVLEEQLTLINRRLAKAQVDNTHLSKALLVKENLIQELKRQLNQLEAEYNAVMIRLESTERGNSSLKYEVRLLEKELDIRNGEREFNQRTADALHKQNLESAKKIAKLESECQRLRLLVRKRLPGPAAMAKMKNEVEMLGRETTEMRRKKSISSGVMVDSMIVSSPETLSEQIRALTEQLYAMGEEKKTLQEALKKKSNELQFSRVLFARTASRLTQAESQIEDSVKSQLNVEQHGSSLTSHEFSLTTVSDVGSDDKASCSESWASALLSELEHFKTGRTKESPSCKSAGASEINLLDDFVEMEKLAIVSSERSFENLQASSKGAHATSSPLENGSNELVSKLEDRGINPMVQDFCMSNWEIKSSAILKSEAPGWLQDILKLIMEQVHVTRRRPGEIIDDIRVSFSDIDNVSSVTSVGMDQCRSIDYDDVSKCNHYEGSPMGMPLNAPPAIRASGGTVDDGVSSIMKGKQLPPSDLSKSVGKIIELIEGIGLPSKDYDNSDSLAKTNDNVFSQKKGTETGYTVRVFQWKTSELGNVLQKTLHVCYDIQNGKIHMEKLIGELTTAFDWIINHCFSLQDVSCMREAIKKQFDWDDSRSESEAELGFESHLPEADEVILCRQFPCVEPVPTSDGCDINIPEAQSKEREKLSKIKSQMINIECEKKVLEGKLLAATDRNKPQKNELDESGEAIDSLSQNEGGKLETEDLDTLVTATKVGSNKTFKDNSKVEADLANVNNHYEEWEAKCVEQSDQNAGSTEERSEYNPVHKESQLRDDWEITAASEKLAECQETILNLGKQLKALATPKGAFLVDNIITSPNEKVSPGISTVTTSHVPSPLKEISMKYRSSLLDQMLAEDDANPRNLEIPRKIEEKLTSNSVHVIEPLENIFLLNGTKHNQVDNAQPHPLAIVPAKKNGGGSLWKKLLWRKKRSNIKRSAPSCVE